jgi:hypothetical protein
MSDHKHDNNHNNQVEGAGIKAKPVLVFLAVLGAATALVYVIILGVEIGLKKFDEMNPQQPATALETGPKLPPEPRLQGAPEPNPDKPGETKASLLPLEDMAAYNKKIKEQTAAYGWVDQPGGIAHIPIERAKEIIAEKGLPKLSDTLVNEIKAAEAARRLVMNAGSNGGRAIKSQKQTTAAPAQTAAQPQTATATAGAKQ